MERALVSPKTITLGVFACIFGGALLRSLMGDALAEHHVSPDSKLRDRARQISMDFGHTRWLLLQQVDPAIPMPFLVVVVFWLTALFASFGLFAPRNLTVIATQLVCALSVSTAIYLILDFEKPFHGLIQISSAPFRNALAHLSR